MKDPGDPSRHDVYGMVIAGFSKPAVVFFYIVAISLLCSHLSHGIASVFQTFGLRTAKTRAAIHGLGLGISVILWLGFLSVPILVAIGTLKDDKATAIHSPASPGQVQQSPLAEN